MHPLPQPTPPVHNSRRVVWIDAELVQAAEDAIHQLESQTCVSFRNKTAYDLDYLMIEPGLE